MIRGARQQLARRIRPLHGAQLRFEVPDLLRQMFDLLAQQGQHLLGQLRHARFRCNRFQQHRHVAAALGGDHAELRGMAAHRIGQFHTLIDQRMAYFQHRRPRLTGPRS
jgi:hypothetical protein